MREDDFRAGGEWASMDQRTTGSTWNLKKACALQVDPKYLVIWSRFLYSFALGPSDSANLRTHWASIIKCLHFGEFRLLLILLRLHLVWEAPRSDDDDSLVEGAEGLCTGSSGVWGEEARPWSLPGEPWGSGEEMTGNLCYIACLSLSWSSQTFGRSQVKLYHSFFQEMIVSPLFQKWVWRCACIML